MPRKHINPLTAQEFIVASEKQRGTSQNYNLECVLFGPRNEDINTSLMTLQIRIVAQQIDELFRNKFIELQYQNYYQIMGSKIKVLTIIKTGKFFIDILKVLTIIVETSYFHKAFG